MKTIVSCWSVNIKTASVNVNISERGKQKKGKCETENRVRDMTVHSGNWENIINCQPQKAMVLKVLLISLWLKLKTNTKN